LLEKEQAIQRAHHESANEIGQLKDTIRNLRQEMENLSFSKEEEMQHSKAMWTSEVNQLSNTSRALRTQL